jgi:hypothetical protein
VGGAEILGMLGLENSKKKKPNFSPFSFHFFAVKKNLTFLP